MLTYTGQTPLIRAVAKGRDAVVKLLLACGYQKEQLQAADDSCMNVLHHVCLGGHVKVFRMLFDHSVEVYTRAMVGLADALGRTCLHLAVGMRYVRTCAYKLCVCVCMYVYVDWRTLLGGRACIWL
jgi:ankyrin repeat protein